jgi:hypothetical protein
MPEIWEDQDDDTPLVQQLRKQIRDKDKKLTDAEARSTAAEGKLTEISLTAALTAKGVNPKAARFIVKDGVDASDETALSAWLDENSDLFPAAAPEAADPPEAGDGDGTSAEMAEGYQQMANVQGIGRPADMNKLTEVNRTLPDNATPDEVFAAYKKAGI